MNEQDQELKVERGAGRQSKPGARRSNPRDVSHWTAPHPREAPEARYVDIESDQRGGSIYSIRTKYGRAGK